VHIITGPGRSGTSFLAAAYRSSGVTIAGEWSEQVRAGYEDGEIVHMNHRMLRYMGSSLLGVKRPISHPSASRLYRSTEGLRAALSTEQRQRLRRAYLHLPWNRTRSLQAPDWERADRVVHEYGPIMRRVAASREMVKDPQFCLTLPLWLRAGARIDSAVVTMRAVDAMLDSRRAADHIGFTSVSDSRNSLLLAVGTLLTTLWDEEVPYVFLRYPEFLYDLESTAESLPLLQGMDRRRLHACLRATLR
jgi:hypothetical protein